MIKSVREELARRWSMLADAGSIASLVGVVVSLGGLGFAIWQLGRLRGETRVAQQAAEETRRSVGRDLALADVSRIWEQIQALKEVHRVGNWGRALFLYPEIRRGLIHIRSRYPDLPDVVSDRIQLGVTQLQRMERTVDSARGDLPQERVSEFNDHLMEIQTVLDELESRLE